MNKKIVTSAVIFDLDGVITDTANIHAKAWKKIFDEFFETSKYLKKNDDFFDIKKDYSLYVDGKTRVEGIKSFLNSRGIKLPFGEIGDMNVFTLCGISNKKNEYYRELIKKNGVTVFQDVFKCLDLLSNICMPLAIATSSMNYDLIMKMLKIPFTFDVIVDGCNLVEKNLKSKPEPDIFIEASRLLNVKPCNCTVIEDSPSGVLAATAAGIGNVIGINRHNNAHDLKNFGANLVIRDLNELSFIFVAKNTF